MLSAALLAGCAGGAETPESGVSKPPATNATGRDYPIVDTGQTTSYDAVGFEIDPADGETPLGCDAQHEGNQPSYTDNDDGTVTDNVTGLMWTRSPDLDDNGTIDFADKRSYKQALASAEGFIYIGYDDWRLPTIKELYSLIDFGGVDPSGNTGDDTSGLIPFIDTAYFDFAYGDTDAGERIIDAQFVTSTKYATTAVGGEDTVFGVNFADGRIKGYPTGPMPGLSADKRFYVLYVRGNSAYGLNSFVDNGDGTITDESTGLMWTQNDSGTGMDWGKALAWADQMNVKESRGYSDWRVPNVKELQSIVDYTRAPAVSNSAAIDPVFNVTQITNEMDAPDAPFYWSSTTHVNDSYMPGANAAYLAFGRATGYINGRWLDVHGAGAQRSDPKTGDPADWPAGRGPQGDAIRIHNYVRLVRDVE